MPDENVADLLESGLYGVMKPKRYGGSELGTETMIDVTIELASADPSTGWVYMLWTAHMWMQAQWPVPGMDEMTDLLNRFGAVVDLDGQSVEQATKVLGDWEPDGLTTFLDAGMVELACVADRLGLPFHSPGTAASFTYKAR